MASAGKESAELPSYRSLREDAEKYAAHLQGLQRLREQIEHHMARQAAPDQASRFPAFDDEDLKFVDQWIREAEFRAESNRRLLEVHRMTAHVRDGLELRDKVFSRFLASPKYGNVVEAYPDFALRLCDRRKRSRALMREIAQDVEQKEARIGLAGRPAVARSVAARSNDDDPSGTAA